MKRSALALILTLVALPAVAQEHKPVVVKARATYDSLTGTQRAFCIVNQVAWDLRVDGAGTFYKSSGTNVNKRSIDIVMYRESRKTFDILGDAENRAIPAWARTKPSGFGNAANWRAPDDPASLVGCDVDVDPPPDVPPPDVPPLPPPDLSEDLSTINQRLDGHDVEIAALKAQVADLNTSITRLTVALAALEQRVVVVEAPCATSQRSTSRSLGHVHDYVTCVQ